MILIKSLAIQGSGSMWKLNSHPKQIQSLRTASKFIFLQFFQVEKNLWPNRISQIYVFALVLHIMSP
jgi:hypothetical protein